MPRNYFLIALVFNAAATIFHDAMFAADAFLLKLFWWLFAFYLENLLINFKKRIFIF